MSDCAGCDHPEKYGHAAYCPESRIDDLRADNERLRGLLRESLDPRIEWDELAARIEAELDGTPVRDSADSAKGSKK